MIITTRMSGFSEWERAFYELAAKNTLILRAAARAAAEQIVEHVKAKTPVGEPPIHMRDQVFWTTSDESGEGAMSGLAIVGNEAPIIVTVRSHYAHFVEFGTSKMPARPFFRPALDEAMEDAARAMQAEAWKALLFVLKIAFFGPPTIVTFVISTAAGFVWDYLGGSVIVGELIDLVF